MDNLIQCEYELQVRCQEIQRQIRAYRLARLCQRRSAIRMRAGAALIAIGTHLQRQPDRINHWEPLEHFS